MREAFPDFTNSASGAHPGAFSLCLGLADRERRRRGAGGGIVMGAVSPPGASERLTIGSLAPAIQLADPP